MPHKVKGKWRFFFHYHKHGEKKLSVHFRGKCFLIDGIHCMNPCESKFNKSEPKLVMQGWASDVRIVTEHGEEIAVIV